MNVRELIEALSNQDPDSQVQVINDNYDGLVWFKPEPLQVIAVGENVFISPNSEAIRQGLLENTLPGGMGRDGPAMCRKIARKMTGTSEKWEAKL